MQMSIDQIGLNKLLSIVRPKSNLDSLKEHRDGLWKKLNQGINTGTGNPDNNSDMKQMITELAEADRQIQQATYEEESRKLELERLKREEAAAKSFREREKALAKNERALQNASMHKLLSAAGKYSVYRTTPGAGAIYSLSQGLPGINNAGYPPQGPLGKSEEINGDIKESVEFGIAAAEVSRRRKRNQMKEENEEAIHKKDTANETGVRKKRKKKSSIDVTL